MVYKQKQTNETQKLTNILIQSMVTKCTKIH